MNTLLMNTPHSACNLVQKAPHPAGDFFSRYIAQSPVLGKNDIHAPTRFAARPNPKDFARDSPHPVPLCSGAPTAAVRYGNAINMQSVLRVPCRQAAA